jgi:hypothetical protein
VCQSESCIQNGCTRAAEIVAEGCCKEVDVKELAAAYRDETGREPVLLVDGHNCLRSMCLCCFKTEELLLGGQMQELINNTKYLLAAFHVTEDPNAFLVNF